MVKASALFLGFFLVASFINADGNDLPNDARSVLGITVDVNTLTDVQHKLGASLVKNSGDAGESESSLCYFQENTKIVFSCSGEMSCPTVNDILVSESDQSNLSGCAQIKKPKLFALPNGIKLGASQKNVKEIFGEPGKIEGEQWIYSWSAIIPVAKNDPNYASWDSRRKECFDGKDPFGDVVSGIEFGFRNRAVHWFSVSRTHSIC